MDGDDAGNKAIETYSSLVKAMRQNTKISKVEVLEREEVNGLENLRFKSEILALGK